MLLCIVFKYILFEHAYIFLKSCWLFDIICKQMYAFLQRKMQRCLQWILKWKFQSYYSIHYSFINFLNDIGIIFASSTKDWDLAIFTLSTVIRIGWFDPAVELPCDQYRCKSIRAVACVCLCCGFLPRYFFQIVHL